MILKLSPFLQCLDTVGWATGRHPACKKLDVGLLMVTIWLEICTSCSSSCHHHLHHINYFNKIQNGDLLVLANPHSSGKWPLKWR